MVSSLLRLSSPRLPILLGRVSTFTLNHSPFVPVGQTNGLHTASPDLSAKSSMFPGFEAVYVSPHIRQIRAACRLKVYQTILVVGMIPTSLMMLEKEMVLPSHVGYVMGFSIFSVVVLGVVGEFFRKFVGIIYLSEDKSKVIISHNTFLGKRADILMDTENVMPLAETPESLDSELVWKIYLYSGEPRSFYICTKYGGILSRRKFADIFGEEIRNK